MFRAPTLQKLSSPFLLTARARNEGPSVHHSPSIQSSKIPKSEEDGTIEISGACFSRATFYFEEIEGDTQHQPWLNGLELLEDAQQNKHILSSGCERIDMLLEGGFCEGYLTELVGPSSSCKTQVCLQAASAVAKIGGVVFLDTGNSFSSKRIAQFLISDPDGKEGNQNILQKVLKSIECHSVFDIFTLLDVLHQLKPNLTSQTGGRVQLLIVDSISSLITPILGGSGSHGHALMISAGSLLKKLAHEHNLAVLVTNHMVSGEGGTHKPALGESWKSIPHVQLQLSREHGSNICNMCILRHPYMASGKAVTFMIP